MSRISGRLAPIVDAAGDLVLAGVFLVTWLAPDAPLALPLGVALLTMLLEFIVVHSTAFMGSVAMGEGTPATRARSVLALGGFYTLFVVGFALAFQTWWPLVSFWVLTINRSLGILFDTTTSGRQALHIRKGWAAVTMSYLLAVGATTVLPVPAFGIDRAVVAAAELPSSGLWVSEPYRVVAAGFLHFLLSGLSALFGHRWITDNSVPG